MDLRDTLLGLLSWRPASGYDLKRIISDSEIFPWSGNNNQIYKSLLELQNEGLVTNEVQVQEKLPAKKVYSITERGRAALHRALLAAPEMPELHKGFLIQLAWAEPLSDDELAALVASYAEEIDIRLRMAQQRMAQQRMARAQAGAHADPASPDDAWPRRSARERYVWRRIAENLVAAYQAELEWAQQTLDDLRTGRYDEHNFGSD